MQASNIFGSSSCKVNQPHSLKIISFDSFGNRVSSNLTNSPESSRSISSLIVEVKRNGEFIHTDIEDLRNYYQITFRPSVASNYEVHVYSAKRENNKEVSKTHISGSPFVVEVTEDLVAASQSDTSSLSSDSFVTLGESEYIKNSKEEESNLD